MATTVSTRIFHSAFHSLAFDYSTGRSDSFPQMQFADRHESEAVLDRLLLGPLSEWPNEALRLLGHSLGAHLVHYRAALIMSLTPSDWSLFNDPADAFFGYAFRGLFEPQGYRLSTYAEQKVEWNDSSVEVLVGAELVSPAID